MSSSGAGIGYALATIKPHITDVEKIVVTLALCLWAISFLLGLHVLRLHRKELHLSGRAMILFRGTSHLGPQAQNVAKSVVDEEAKSLGPKVHVAHGAQVILLMFGAAIFATVKLEIVPTLAEWFFNAP